MCILTFEYLLNQMDPLPMYLFSATSAQMLLVVLAIVCAYVSLDSARRVEAPSLKQGLQSLLGSALALGTGVWAMHIVGLLTQAPRFNVGYEPWLLMLSWGLGVGLSALSWGLVGFCRPRPLVVLGSGSLLTAACLLPHVVGILAIDLQPGPLWSSHHVLSALILTLICCVLVTVLLMLSKTNQRHTWLPPTLATLLLSVALWWSQQAMTRAVGIEFQVSSGQAAGALSHHALTFLAMLSAPLVMLMTWSTTLIASRMRTSLVQAEGALQRQVQTDPVTGMFTRQYFEEHLARAAFQSDRNKSSLALLLVDLDGFHLINESFGHRFGDELLQAVAGRLREFCAPGMVLARLGGDEFLVLLEPGLSKDNVAARTRLLLDHLGQPIQVGDRELQVAASIGIALYPNDGAQSTLISHADVAAHAATHLGGATYCFFEPQLLDNAREQVDLLHDLRNALVKNEFELYYQPKIHVPSGEITGAEALLRWNHPVRGLVSPAVFIPVAERYALINTIGDWVIDEACRQIRIWRQGGLRMRVAINLSSQQLRQPDMLNRLQSALQRHSVNPTQLTCEITESMAMDATDSIQQFFEGLGQLGIRISIDDFGTGYSSLSQLRQLPTEELKIDKSFVHDLETSDDARAVVDAVVKLGLALRLKVVAEGVETEGQHRILRELGCNELQGYLFARPMAAKSLYLWAKFDHGPSTLSFRSSLFGDTRLPEQES